MKQIQECSLIDYMEQIDKALNRLGLDTEALIKKGVYIRRETFSSGRWVINNNGNQVYTVKDQNAVFFPKEWENKWLVEQDISEYLNCLDEAVIKKQTDNKQHNGQKREN